MAGIGSRGGRRIARRMGTLIKRRRPARQIPSVLSDGTDISEATLIPGPPHPAVVDSTPLVKTPKIIEGHYRKVEIHVPHAADAAPGIRFYGRLVKSLVFSTDPYIIRNCDADAVFGVGPFTSQPDITHALVHLAGRPVLVGVAGTLTTGMRSVEIAMASEMHGVSGVVVNMTVSPDVVRVISASVDVPVIATVASANDASLANIEAGASIVNVAAGKQTPEVVRELRKLYPDIPLMASGGTTEESMAATIDAGADAVIWTPPSLIDLQRMVMEKNRRR